MRMCLLWFKSGNQIITPRNLLCGLMYTVTPVEDGRFVLVKIQEIVCGRKFDDLKYVCQDSAQLGC